MSGYVVRGNALKLPLPDESVDLIVTSPPYYSLRSYRDSGEHYTGQIGSEPTPQEWLEALWACMHEWWRVLKSSGSVFVNLGDKRAGSGGHNNSGITTLPKKSIEQAIAEQKARERAKGYSGGDKRALAREASRRNAPDRYNQAAFGRAKSKMLLPHRFAIGCEDGLADPQSIGWIVRQDLIWHKLNGLPESVTDRHRDSHEFIFHLTKQERYFAAMDEIREAQKEFISGVDGPKRGRGFGGDEQTSGLAHKDGGWNDYRERGGINYNALGKLPGSVWPMASEPLIIPTWAREKLNLPDHFAAFPSELPRKLILAFSPSGICTACGQGWRPVVERKPMEIQPSARRLAAQANGEQSRTATGGTMTSSAEATIIGYACACTPYTDHKEPRPKRIPGGTLEKGRESFLSQEEFEQLGGRVSWREYHLDGWTPPPTRPAVVLDPFGGTGTVAMVAKQLGRIGISVDLSADYSRLAQWRIANPPSKIMERTWGERQLTLG